MAAKQLPAPKGEKPKQKKKKTGGRTAGTPNKKTTEQRERTEELVNRVWREGMLPLDIMLEAMKAAYELGGAVYAHEFAKDAAPFVHPKLANIDANIQGDFIVEVTRFAPEKPAKPT